jgi:3-oxoacyl-[acyl-carrier protein] reductase
MELGLKGRRALVTAASRGLGRACAEALAAEGADVYIASRDEPSIKSAAEGMGARGWMAADVSRGADVTRLVDTALQTLGGLDILVSNAGGPPPGQFEDIEEAAWDTAYQVTLMSSVRLIKAALPHLKQSDQGRIVIITSVSVRQPIPNLLLSNSLRSAVTSMAKTISFDIGPSGVTINNLAPDAILTDRLKSLRRAAAEKSGRSLDEELEAFRHHIPTRKLGDPADFGAMCAFLCSARAGHITGQTIGIDGGALLGVH